MARSRRQRERDRELTRDEVWVPPLHELPEPWERDNALFEYRLFKRSGWVGRIGVAVIVVALLFMFAAEAYRAIVG